MPNEMSFQNTDLQRQYGAIAPRMSERQGSSVYITLQDGTTKVDMTSQVFNFAPILAYGSILSAIRNTTGSEVSDGENTSTIYRKLLLADSIEWIKYDKTTQESVQVNDIFDLSKFSEQFPASKMIGIRLNSKIVTQATMLTSWDGQLNTVGMELLGRRLSNFILQRQAQKQTEGLEDMVASFKSITIHKADGTTIATTFKDGAHVEVATADDDPKVYYDGFWQGRDVLLSQGLKNAVGIENIAYKGAVGIQPNELIALVSTAYTPVLKTMPGLYASWKGFDAFGAIGFRNVLGVDTITTANLPADVHYLMFTTGNNGVLGYQRVGKMIGGQIAPHPTRPGLAWILNMWDQYTLGTVLPFQGVAFLKHGSTREVPKTVQGVQSNGQIGQVKYTEWEKRDSDTEVAKSSKPKK